MLIDKYQAQRTGLKGLHFFKSRLKSIHFHQLSRSRTMGSPFTSTSVSWLNLD